MNKMILRVLPILLLGGLLGCSNNNVTSTPESKPYSYDEAITRGDVVYFNKLYNPEKFDQFLTNLNNTIADNIRITGYTDEGDPIFKDLKFDGNVIQYTYDNSNDAFGGSNKGIRTDLCSKITSEENADGQVDYMISSCTNNNPEISYFLLRTEK